MQDYLLVTYPNNPLPLQHKPKNAVMEHYTFEQLPQAISLLHEKISHIEQVLLERQPQPETEQVFNISQATAYLNLSVATLYSKVSRQEIPVNKQGNWMKSMTRSDTSTPMIGKVMIGKSFGGCVRYNVLKQEAKILHPDG